MIGIAPAIQRMVRSHYATVNQERRITYDDRRFIADTRWIAEVSLFVPSDQTFYNRKYNIGQ